MATRDPAALTGVHLAIGKAMSPHDPHFGHSLQDEPSHSGADDQAMLDALGEFELDCPTCGINLLGEELFDTFRVCPSCRRHFSLPARERLTLVVDQGTFQETNAALISVDPLVFHDQLPFPDRLAEAQERSGVSEAVITGIGEIGGQSAILLLLDFHYLGGSIGVVAGEKILLAMEMAATRRMPLIAFCSGGAARTQEGMLSLVQIAKTASASARLHRAGVPFVSVLTHPTTGGVYTGLGGQADIILAEPGAWIGLNPARRLTPGITDGGTTNAETMLAHGMIDAVVDRAQLRDLLSNLLNLFAVRGTPRPGAPLVSLSGGSVPTWEAEARARNPKRPTSLTYIRKLMPSFVELHGDRTTGDDPAVVCGIGRLDGVTIAIIGQERGDDGTAEKRAGGRMNAAGYRKAVRMMRLAGHLELPLVTMIDTPGTMTGVDAEVDGLGLAISQSLAMISMLPVPVICTLIGEGGGTGAIALGVGDRILMQENAVYSVIGPEKAGMPLHRASSQATSAATSLMLTSRECQRLGVVNTVIPEPLGGAHADPDFAAAQLRTAIVQSLSDLAGVGPRRLLEDRSRKIRYMGQTTPEGREAAKLELKELQELQRTLSKSIGELRDDLRVRWENRNLTLPNLPNIPRLHLHRPDLGDLADRLAALRASVPSPGSVRQTARPPAGDGDDDGPEEESA
jgi:acetyl-CoA carboxylase carboxyl transferase alpha subunit/acetyl-CoA carboxylase carboxyl transferase beta subunit